MKIELDLGFSHIRDSIWAIDEKLASMALNDERRPGLQHLRDHIMREIPVGLQKQISQ